MYIFKAMNIGPQDFLLFSGPCSLESVDHIKSSFQALSQLPLTAVRCALFKSRTSPDSFQGLGTKHLNMVRGLKKDLGLRLITEVTYSSQIQTLEDTVDIFQIGTRNMFNYELLKDLNTCGKPVLLKRNFAATIDEWLSAAEYLKNCESVVLCERGIRTFETKTRNTLDIGAIAYLKKNTSYPVIADPSHGTGRRELVSQLALAALHGGGDGLMIEVHEKPEKALSDGFQSLNLEELKGFSLNLSRHLDFLGKKILTQF